MEIPTSLETCFESCMPFFIALGDDVRLTIIKVLASTGSGSLKHGLKVKEITEQTNLSRPAISHHLKILKDAGLVHVRKEGTSNYYYLTIVDSTKRMMNLGNELQKIWGFDV